MLIAPLALCLLRLLREHFAFIVCVLQLNCVLKLLLQPFFQEAFVFSMLEDDAHSSMVCTLLLYLMAKVLLLHGLSES